MQAEIRIRPAEEDDARALAALAEKTFRDTFAGAHTAADMQLHCTRSYGPALQLAEIRDSGRETWLAESEGRLIAFVQLRLAAATPLISGERPMEIQRFYVDASHHGAGVAYQLMAHALARARATGSVTLWLGVWEKNLRALAFYQKWGFEVVAAHIFEVGDDPKRDLIMRRDVLSAEADSSPPARRSR